jgi:hypothetical protein
MQGRTATLASKTAISTTWSMTTGLDYTPKSFIVTLLANDGTYYVSEVLAAVVSSGTALQALNVTNAGIRISNPDEFALLGDSEKKDKDFALSSDIDLADSGAWDGPDGYSGHFYGNGYTITGLVLDKTGGDTGLFDKVSDGAVIQDFTVVVSTKLPVEARTAASHFGGVVGLVNGSATIWVKDVQVKGTLDYGPVNVTNCFLLAGGIIGEISPGSDVTLERCVTNINISLDAGNVIGGGFTLGFGGLVGKAFSTLNIKQCYAAGNIMLNHNASKTLIAGGLVGQKYGGSLTIEESYASGNIIAKNIYGSNNQNIIAAGLLGDATSSPNITIRKSAALNEKVLAITGSSYSKSGRLVGMANGTATYQNNRARLDMYTGYTDEGTLNDASGSLTTVAGLGTSLEDFKLKATWTTGSDGLAWDETVWDFSGLSQGKWPTLK